MAKVRDNIRIYGDDEGAVFVADKGTTGPTDLTAPGVGFEELGWLSEDGVDLDRNEDVQEFKGWQGGKLLRKKITSVDDTFKFQCLEETAAVLGLYYKGQVPTVTGTGAAAVAKITVTNQAVSDERAWVVDAFDGEVQKRYVVPSGEVTARATISHKNSDMTIYEFTVTVYGDYDLYTNAPAVTGISA